jgi:sugar phosphate isomerase/epimerase
MVRAAEWQGFDGIELGLGDVKAAARAIPQQRRQLDVLNVQTIHDLLGADPNPQAREAKEMEALHYLGEARHVRAQAVLTCLPMELVTDPTTAVAQLCWLADRAVNDNPAKPVDVWVEALSWGTAYTTPAAAWEVVAAARRAGWDNVWLVLDTYHMFARGFTISRLADSGINLAHLAAVQISDAPEKPCADNVKRMARHDRLPDKGIWDDDIRALIAWLRAADYDGWWSWEVFSDRLAALEPDVAAKELLGAAHRLLPILAGP